MVLITQVPQIDISGGEMLSSPVGGSLQTRGRGHCRVPGAPRGLAASPATQPATSRTRYRVQHHGARQHAAYNAQHGDPADSEQPTTNKVNISFLNINGNFANTSKSLQFNSNHPTVQ